MRLLTRTLVLTLFLCNAALAGPADDFVEIRDAVPGVVEHGLFTDMARLAVVARAGGVEEIAPRMNQWS